MLTIYSYPKRASTILTKILLTFVQILNMNGLLLAGTAVFGFIRIVNSLFGDKQPLKQDGKPQYIINNKVTPLHPIEKSYEVLGLDLNTVISPGVINKAFSKQLEYANEDRMLGYKVKHSLKEYQLAKEYLWDYYNYAAFLN